MAIRPRQRFGFTVGLVALICCFGALVRYQAISACPSHSQPTDPLKALAGIGHQTQSKKLSDNPGPSNPWLAARGRRLTDQQIREVGDQLKTFPSQRFWIVSETDGDTAESEQTRFARQLRAALFSGQWTESQKVMQRKGGDGFVETSMASYSRGGDMGVVLFAAPDSIVAATALNAALTSMLIRTSLEPDDNLKSAILVFVGTP